MADQRKITLYPGHGTPQNIILRALPIATLAAGTTIYLYPGHAADKNIILRNPLVAEAAGTPGPITANLTVTFDGVTLTGAAVLPIAAAATLTFDDLTTTGSGVLLIAADAGITLDDVTTTTAAAISITADATFTFDDLSLTTSVGLAGASTGDHPVSILLSPIWHIPFTKTGGVIGNAADSFLYQFVEVFNGKEVAPGVTMSSIWNLRIFVGTGTPNGVVTGSPPDIYLNKSGGAGTTVYMKESGDETDTGWSGI